MDRIGRELVRAISAQEEQGLVSAVAYQLADHLEAELVGPVQVVEDQERRPVHRVEDPVGGAPDEQAPRPEGVAVVDSVHRQQVRTQRPEIRVLAHAVRHFPDRREGNLAVLGGHAAAFIAQACRDGLAARRPDQPCLAQARLAGQEEGVTTPLAGFVDQVIDELEQVVAADDDRTQHRPSAAHGWAV